MQHIYNESRFGENWFTYQSIYKRAIKIAKPNSHFVEIGSWKGKSSAFMCVEIANSNKNIKFDCIDTWHGSQEHGNIYHNNDDLYNLFLDNMSSLSQYYTSIRMSSIDASKLYKDNSLFFVFLDGDHSYDAVKQDLISWLPKIKKGGIFAGHDYHYYDGVKKAVDEILGHNIFTYEKEICWWYLKV